MNKSLVIFKRITCVLGILFMVLGVVPIPAVSVIDEASASSISLSDGQSLPKFSSINIVDTLNDGDDELPEDPGPEDPDPGDPPDDPEVPPDDPDDGGDCPEGETCDDGDGEDGSDDGECPEGETCDDGDGEGGSDDGDCPEGETCGDGGEDPEGVEGTTHGCKTEGRRCGGMWGSCCDGLDCENGRCRVSCTPSTDCPTECGYEGGDVPDGCGGTHYCGPTPACCDPFEACLTECGQPAQDLPDGECGTHHCEATEECAPSCVPENGWCDPNTDCCEGLVCNGHTCKASTHECKTAGFPCGGNNECCEGLTCNDMPGAEPDKCGPPVEPIDCQFHYSECECGFFGCWRTLIIDQYPQNGGEPCPVIWYIPCSGEDG